MAFIPIVYRSYRTGKKTKVFFFSQILISEFKRSALKSFRESRCIHLKQLYGLSKNSDLLRFDYIWCRRIHRSKTTKKSFLKESAVLTEAFSLAVGAKIWIQMWNLSLGMIKNKIFSVSWTLEQLKILILRRRFDS